MRDAAHHFDAGVAREEAPDEIQEDPVVDDMLPPLEDQSRPQAQESQQAFLQGK
jgi:hypothetical protein